MKRDMELVRRILVKVEQAEGPVDLETFVNAEHGMADVSYHVQLMEAHGLVDADLLYADDRVYRGYVAVLTWDGCDFLDAIKDDTIWKKTKAAVKKVSSSATLDTFRQVAVMVVTQAVRSNLGV